MADEPKRTTTIVIEDWINETTDRGGTKLGGCCYCRGGGAECDCCGQSQAPYVVLERARDLLVQATLCIDDPILRDAVRVFVHQLDQDRANYRAFLQAIADDNAARGGSE
jgi:hypothetical protein